MKTRKISIFRTITIETTNLKDGSIKREKQIKRFPVRINADVPPSHRMCENEVNF